MDSRNILMILCFLMTCSCQPWGTQEMDRWQPPPIVSFLKQLQKIHGGPDARAPQKPGPKAEDRLTGWAQLEGPRQQLNLFGSSIPGRRVPRQLQASSSMRGCHLGTCQIQNLANLLYRYGGNNQKDESHKNSKGTTDPMGYGRRKRRAAGHGVSTPT
ncbi:pro-adrenomedullin-like [Hemicordylus capensis]|uniref:pro-adrenomedullin-like n=1 Tax=Hemicordylus capensis TaxID=884348 RepID=UPI002303EBCA|nr:pro-adrenomedullin-like [Hemicordylus capensis]